MSKKASSRFIIESDLDYNTDSKFFLSTKNEER